MCRRCWESQCNEGHGKGDKNKGWHPFRVFLAISILTTMGLAFGLVGLMDVCLSLQWDNLDTVTISDISEGDTVKIEGTILGEPNEIIITGEEESRRSGYEWVFYDNVSFYLNDSTGSIKISTEKYFKIEEGIHLAPNSKYSDGKTYNAGDNITLIGEVKTQDNEKIVYLLWVGPKDSDITVSIWSFFLVFIILIPTIIGYLYVLMIAINKNRLHNKKVSYKNPIEINKNEMIKDLELNWRKNTRISRRLFGFIVAFLIIAGFLILILTYIVFSSYIHTYTQYLLSGIIPMMVLPFMMVFPLIYYLSREDIKTDEIAFSGRGIHFHYDDPIIRYLKDDFIGWDEIKEIKCHSGKSTTWFIIKKNDTSENITGLRGDIRQQLISLLNKYKRIKANKR
ncbi:hypothetical protein [[Eubacterium] cellulosolvens]